MVRIGLAFLSIKYFVEFILYYFGKNELYFFIMKLAVFEIYNSLTRPGFVLFAKMVPSELEITLVAIFKTFYYSSLFVYGRLLCDLLVYLADLALSDEWSLLFVFIFGMIGSLTLQTRI